MKKTGKRQEEHTNMAAELLRGLLKGGVLGLGIVMAVLLACAFAGAQGVLSQQHLTNCVYAACVSGGAVAGAAALRRRRELAIQLGMAGGGILFLLLLLIGVLMKGSAPSAENVPTIFLSCLCGGACAGVLGRKSKKKRKR